MSQSSAFNARQVLDRSLTKHGVQALGPYFDSTFWFRDSVFADVEIPRDALATVFSSTWQALVMTSKLAEQLPPLSTVIPYWVDPIAFDPDKHYREKKRFVFASSLDNGFMILYHTLKHIREQTNVKLELTVFSNDETPLFVDTINSAMDEDWFDWRGRCDNAEVREVMADANFLALPATNFDSCSMQVLEAMSSGTIPIVPKRAGLFETVKFDFGNLYPAVDNAVEHAGLLASAIMAMIETKPENLIAMANTYQATANHAYSFDVVSNQWMVLSDTLSRR